MNAQTRAERHACRTLINRLTTIIDAARDLADEAHQLGMRSTARVLRNSITTLDGARVRLIEDGSEYLDAATAFINAGERMLIDRAAAIGRIQNARLLIG